MGNPTLKRGKPLTEPSVGLQGGVRVDRACEKEKSKIEEWKTPMKFRVKALNA